VDLVLGLSMTSASVRIVLVEGASGDGATIDHAEFDLATLHRAAEGSPIDLVVDVVLGTQASADAGGHYPRAIGVTWTDDAYTDASMLLESLATEGLYDVVAVPGVDAAEALALGIAHVVRCEEVAVCIAEPDAALLAMVKTNNGEVVDSVYGMLDSPDPDPVIDALAGILESPYWHPDGIYIVGSVHDLDLITADIAAELRAHVVSTTEAELALARGAAMASARARGGAAAAALLANERGEPGYGASAADPMGVPRIARLAAMQDSTSSDDDPAAEPGARRPWALSRANALTSVLVAAVLTFVVSLSVAVGLRFAPNHGAATAAHPGLANTSGPPPIAQPTPVPDAPQAPLGAVPSAPDLATSAPEEPPPAMPDPALEVTQQVQQVAVAPPAPDASPPVDPQAAPPAADPAAPPPASQPGAPPAASPPVVSPPAASPPPADVPPDQHLTLRERILRHFPGLHLGGQDQSPDQSAPAQGPDAPATPPQPGQNP
jgi:hypothetical protein